MLDDTPERRPVSELYKAEKMPQVKPEITGADDGARDLPWFARLWFVPAVLAAVALVTLVTCVIITLASGTYVGGIYPTSQTPEDPPAYYVFALGLTTVGILMFP